MAEGMIMETNGIGYTKMTLDAQKTAVAYTKKRAAYTNQQADFQTDKQSVYAVYAKTKNIFHTKRINTQKSYIL